MKKWMQRALLASGIASCVFLKVPAETFTIQLTVVVDHAASPQKVTLEGGMAPPIELARTATEPRFERLVDLSNPDIVLRREFELVVDWGVPKREVLFLGLGPVSTNPATIPIFYLECSADISGIEKLESLGTDFRGQLCRYLGGRAIFRKLKEEGLGNHVAALRSARIWFDASVQLVLDVDSTIFRMDEEVARILNAFEVRSETDVAFRNRWRRITDPGYVHGMLSQCEAREFAVVGRIPELIEAGEFESAALLNSMAISAFTALSNEAQATVVTRERVDLHLLERNRAFLATKLNQSSQPR